MIPTMADSVSSDSRTWALPHRPVTSPATSPEMVEILVVDDRVDQLLTLGHVLGSPEYRLRTARSGQDALRLLSEHDFAVLLLDVYMPGMDGFELARRLRAIPETRASLYVALTGYGQPGDRLSAREAGFDHHLTKPADPNEVLELIAAWRSARQAAPRDEPAAGAAAEHT